MKCANYMNFEAIRETVREHHEKWGPPGESMSYNLSDFNLTRLCSVCDFGGTGSATLDQIARIFDEGAISVQNTIRNLTGEPLRRVCFKELVPNDATWKAKQ